MNTTQLNISRTLIDLKVVREFQRSVVEVIAEESVLAPLAVGGVTYPLARKALTPHSAHSRGHKRYLGCNLLHHNVLTSQHQHQVAQAPLRAWQTMPACRPPDRDEDDTLKVTIDLTGERATSEIVEVAWTAAGPRSSGSAQCPIWASRQRTSSPNRTRRAASTRHRPRRTDA